MDKPNRYEPPLLRRVILVGVIGGVASLLVNFLFARNANLYLVTAFRDSDPWVLPAIVIGLLALCLCIALVLSQIFRRRGIK